jgi:peptidoglycan/LPS O-acetylase OafA/YrhL
VRYNPALDGLRAVAITLVILTHSFRAVFPGGWIGVDVFFVLSGYLITSILMKELRETGQIAGINFYARRFLRLTPALSVLVVFQLARSAISPNGAEIREATFIGATYIENWNNVTQFGPYDMMGHTWSLATEEQFYWVWPLTLLFIFRRHPLLWVGLAIAVMLAFRLLLWRSGATLGHLQVSPETRPIGLLMGCLLAMIPHSRWPQFPTAVPVALLSLLGFICVAHTGDMQWPMIAAPVAASVAGAGLIVASQPGSQMAGMLSIRPAVYVGKISYGLYLYLYHWPIFILGEKWKFSTTFHMYVAALIALIFVAAALSYEFVEKPFLGFKDRFRRRTAIGVPSGSGLAVRP